jgi:SAM-dependent methyltransferase
MEEPNRVQWVYASTNNQELEERYDVWAKEYDADLDQDFGWMCTQRSAEALARHAPVDASVLDAGAGTGLAGEILANLGYNDLVAMDLSQGMLDVAGAKGVYRALDQMTLGERLDYPDGRFGAVICVGVMTLGHAPASSLEELARVTKPDGFVVFSLRADMYSLGSEFEQQQTKMESEGIWSLVEATDPFLGLPKGEPDVYHQVWVYRVSS